MSNAWKIMDWLGEIVNKIIMQETRFLDKAMPSEVENSVLFEK